MTVLISQLVRDNTMSQTSWGDNYWGQSFTLSSSTLVTGISLWCSANWGSGSNATTVKLYSDQGITLVNTTESLVVSAAGFYDFVFASPTSLAAGTYYFRPDATTPALLELGMTNSNNYADGAWYQVLNETWTARSSDLTFKVHYSPTFSVTYDGNGSTSGSQADGNSPFMPGSNVTVLGLGNLVKTNYAFLGWNTAANGSGTSYLPSSIISDIQADVTLYAQWALVIITGTSIKSDADDGISDGKITLSQDMTVEATGDLTLNVATLNDLAGDKIITVTAGGKISLAGGSVITVLEGTKYKLRT